MILAEEQLKLYKDFEWEWPEYDILKPYERYDAKLLLLTKLALNVRERSTGNSAPLNETF